MATIANALANVPSWVWILCGFALSLWLGRPSEKTKVKISDRSWAYSLLLLNFLFLVWNASFMFRITAITSEVATGSNKVTSADIDFFNSVSQFFAVFAWVVLGFIVGTIIIAIWRGAKNKQEEAKADKKTGERQVNIDLKINTADVAKMKKEQANATIKIIDKIASTEDYNSPPKTEEKSKKRERLE
jgi:hypothetical protein